MAVSKVSPLAWNMPIVDKKGNPTPYFVRQLEQLLAEKLVTDTLAAEAVPQSRLINTTSPITGGGDLSADLTIALDSSTLNESIQDMLSTFLVAGSNVTLTYNDVANTLTISTSGGGSGAWTLISSQTLASPTATVTFSSIPNTYKHLILTSRMRSVTAAAVDNNRMRFNGDTGANYDYMEGHTVNSTYSVGSAFAQTSFLNAAINAGTAPANSFTPMIMEILQYANTNMTKEIMWRDSGNSTQTAAGYRVGAGGGTWRNTAAINQIDLFNNSGSNFATNSTFSLYGVI